MRSCRNARHPYRCRYAGRSPRSERRSRSLPFVLLVPLLHQFAQVQVVLKGGHVIALGRLDAVDLQFVVVVVEELDREGDAFALDGDGPHDIRRTKSVVALNSSSAIFMR